MTYRRVCPIGVMQGRLLPKYKGRYQAHPVGYWQDEFPIAAKLGLNCIEFILDFNDAEVNPLLTADGNREIKRVVDKTNIHVHSVCADYFMEAPLHSADKAVVKSSQNTLSELIKHCADLGISDIVIPCVDQSSLTDASAIERFQEGISPLFPLAIDASLNLSLETDLAPQDFGNLLKKLNSTCIKVNYDTGNSAALGYDPQEELAVYGNAISDVHIKDRLLSGGSVKLGTGNANLPAFFTELAKLNYSGPIILQAYRDDEGINIFREQLTWLTERGWLT